jgi:hypothetical protein
MVVQHFVQIVGAEVLYKLGSCRFGATEVPWHSIGLLVPDSTPDTFPWGQYTVHLSNTFANVT